jgi:hypothetical protein
MITEKNSGIGDTIAPPFFQKGVEEHVATAVGSEAQGRMSHNAYRALVLSPAYNEVGVIGSVIQQIRARPSG